MRYPFESLFPLVALTAAALGCTQSEPQKPTASEPVATAAVKSEHNHRGWWCVEHGLPEEECSMCSAQAAAKFKEQGDWCEDHDRAKSQCFICDPSLADKYAKLYEAKFGEKPPQRTE